MATVKGVWVFNETITKIPVSENVNFSVTFSDGHIINYDRMFISGNDLGYKQAGQSAVTCAYYHSISPNRWTNEIWRTVDFGTTEQTVTDAFYTWLTTNAVQQGSDPSEPTTDILYTVNGSSLTAVANAIRGKTGTTGELAFPDGYVSAVNGISSVSDLSNAKDIAFGGNESGGKYVIEDETITPLFKQVKRIAETEENMTFEEAEQSLLNVFPGGGGLPSAEESGFGNDSNMGCGIVSEGTAGTTTTKSMTMGYVFTASEAFSIIGLRHKQANSARLKLWDSSGNVVTTISAPGVSEWENYYFDTPINVAIGETYTVTAYCYQPKVVAMSNTTFNNKLTGIEVRYSARETTFPTTTGGASSVACVDIIIAPVAAELPDSYEIQRTTMDDIAIEIQRITGTEGKMTTAQIIAALEAM